MNLCLFVGNLAKDVELRELPSGTKVAKVRLAVNNKRRDDLPQETAFLDLEAWDSAAEYLATTFKKGSRIFVQCSVKNDNWTSKDGQKKSRTVFRINNFGAVQKTKRVEEVDDVCF